MKVPAFIKNYIIDFSVKDIIYLFVIACVAIVFGHGCGKKSINSIIGKPVIQPTVQKTDKKGTPYTEIKGVIYTQAQMDAVSDSFRKVLKSGKVIEVIRSVSAPIHDTASVTAYVDTTQHLMSASDTTRYYSIGFTGNWKTKKGTFTFDLVPDTASYVTTWKHRLFQPDLLTVNVYHTDTLFTPIYGGVYTAKAPRPLFDFDVMIVYDVVHKQIAVGPGVGIHIFSIKSKN